MLIWTHLLLNLFACGTKLPPVLEDPYNNPPEQCKSATHVHAIGIGSSPSESLNSAHEAIAKQIFSKIEAESKSTSEFKKSSTSQGDKVDVSQQATKVLKSQIKISSSFEHNDLIEDKIAPIEKDGNYYSLSCLHKFKAEEVLLGELSPKVQSFQHSVEEALILGNSRDFAGFSSQYAKISKEKELLLTEFYIISSISGRKSQMFIDFENSWMKLDNLATELRTSLLIGLNIEASKIENEQQKIVLNGLRKNLGERGIKVIESKSCSKEQSHFVAITELEENCKELSIGIFHCEPMLSLDIQECISTNNFSVSLQGKYFSGQDGNSIERAFEQALKRMDSDDFRKGFYSELETIIPLGLQE